MNIKSKNKGFSKYELTNAECDNLLLSAKKSIKYTFPKSNDGFAVALMTKAGHIYTCASYKSDTHNLTMHSEAVALAMAAQNGETEIVAITGPNCHNCKQLIWESKI